MGRDGSLIFFNTPIRVVRSRKNPAQTPYDIVRKVLINQIACPTLYISDLGVCGLYAAPQQAGVHAIVLSGAGGCAGIVVSIEAPSGLFHHLDETHGHGGGGDIAQIATGRISGGGPAG